MTVPPHIEPTRPKTESRLVCVDDERTEMARTKKVQPRPSKRTNELRDEGCLGVGMGTNRRAANSESASHLGAGRGEGRARLLMPGGISLPRLMFHFTQIWWIVVRAGKCCIGYEQSAVTAMHTRTCRARVRLPRKAG